MIYTYRGVKVPSWHEHTDKNKANEQYLKSSMVLGLLTEDKVLEKDFIDMFKSFDINDNIFLYSDFPDEDLGLGGGSELVQFIFDTSTQFAYDIVVTLLADMVVSQGKVVFDHLKFFLLKTTKEKKQRIAIKFKTQYGLEATYRLPKHLNPTQIETAVESIEKDIEGGKQIQQKIFTTMTFDTKTEKFEED